MRARSAFTLIELMVVVAIIGMLASIAVVELNQSRVKARDSERKMEVSRFGRILTGNCYLPDAGPGDYDISTVVPELMSKNEQYAEYLRIIPIDPNGTNATTKYRYLVTADRHCAMYANLENRNERITLLAPLTAPTANSGNGVFQATAPGVNGTNRFFQVSN